MQAPGSVESIPFMDDDEDSEELRRTDINCNGQTNNFNNKIQRKPIKTFITTTSKQPTVTQPFSVVAPMHILPHEPEDYISSILTTDHLEQHLDGEFQNGLSHTPLLPKSEAACDVASNEVSPDAVPLPLFGLPPIARAETLESFASHSDISSLKKQPSVESYENFDEKQDTGSEKLETVTENFSAGGAFESLKDESPGKGLEPALTDNVETRSYKLAISMEPMTIVDIDIGEKKTQSLKLFTPNRQQSSESSSSTNHNSLPTTPQGKKSGKFSYVKRTSSFKQDTPAAPRHIYKNDVWNGRTAEDVPSEQIASYLLSPEIFASYSGPDSGLVFAETGKTIIDSRSSDTEIAGATSWACKNRKAYGICLSLYDQHPINGKMSGDPIADSFAICARRNSATLIVADGVNWGEKSRLAARCAVYGAMTYLSKKLFQEKRQLETTRDAIQYIRESFDAAHQKIIEKEGGLTTLCVALVLPMKESRQFAVCSVNVGDSFCFVFSKRWGIREISIGSHDIQSERDIRDAGGALGPVDGTNPELNNLTCSLTFVDPGDIVFLTSDGISDNFDPVVTKLAVAMKRSSSDPSIGQDIANKVDAVSHKPEMLPHERHHYSVKEMERVIHQFELDTEISVSAQELAGALVQHVCLLTDSKRKVLENPELYGKKLRSKERKRRDTAIVEKMSKAPGKLDHATIVAYECGVYRGEELENYEYDIGEDTTCVVRDERGMVSPKSPPSSPTVYESAV